MSSVADLPIAPLRAPAAHGEALVAPGREAATEMLLENRRRTAATTIQVGGIDFQRLLSVARQELLQEARQYVDEYLPATPIPPAGGPVVLVGHQPELFHPGVWFKNFLLSEFASRRHAVAIHLITDQDVIRNAGVRVPTGSVDDPELKFIPWDSQRQLVPAEECRVHDWDHWRNFGARVERAVRPLIPDPLIRQLWPEVCVAARRTRPAYAISQARHLMERSCGLETWEVPLSRVCQGQAFHYFVWHILEHLPRFHEVYHQALSDYRRQYRIRSRTHPFPALQADADAREAPFWIWSTDDSRRRPLWLREHRDGWRLFAQGSDVISRQLNVSGLGTGTGIASLRDLADHGIKIRPRAVTTTMFARLLLCDLFVHGLGGSKYDRLTDQVLEQFWEIRPPGYLTATATFRLPWSQPSATSDDLRCLQGELRELWFHPEYHLDGLVELDRRLAESLADRKRRLVTCPPPRGQRRGWHGEIERINHQLRHLVEPRRIQLERWRDAAVSRRRSFEVLSSREYPYCIFAKADLCGQLLDTAHHFA